MPAGLFDDDEVGARLTHPAERLGDRQIVLEGQARPHEFPGRGVAVDVDRVPRVDHADRGVVLEDQQAQMAGAARGVANLPRARVDADRGHLLGRGGLIEVALAEQVAHGELLQLEGAEQLPLMGVVERPGLAGVPDELTQRVGVLARGDLVHGLDAQAVQHRVGGVVEHEQQRAGQPQEAAHRQRQQGGRVLGVGDGP